VALPLLETQPRRFLGWGKCQLAIIKQALGHESIAFTVVYVVPIDETAGKAVTAALASMF
jgi:hypothetical protein